MTMRENIKAAVGNGPNYERDADAIVDAVLDAIRKPTRGQLDAGWKRVQTALVDGRDEALSDLYTAMIDAAKGEHE